MARPYCYFATGTISLFLLAWQSLEDYLHNVSSTTFLLPSQGRRMQNIRNIQQWALKNSNCFPIRLHKVKLLSEPPIRHQAPLLNLLHLPHSWQFHSSQSTVRRLKLLLLYCSLCILTRVIYVI